MVCPKCGSTNVRVDSGKKFSLGKAALGAVVAGPLIGAALGATGKKWVQAVCQNCGYAGNIKK